MSTDPIYKAFGQAVAVRRNELDLTQAQLAARVGMSRASIANIESGRQNVLLHSVYRLATALEFSKASELLPPLTKSMPQEELPMLDDSDLSPKQRAQVNDVMATALAAAGQGKARA